MPRRTDLVMDWAERSRRHCGQHLADDDADHGETPVACRSNDATNTKERLLAGMKAK
ncbi:MAG: hypothetical protein L0Z50_39795 [Verrucomicrobiales bacterium]|nr:hypothetical protein [Verrucomicrobiales bacterium]